MTSRVRDRRSYLGPRARLMVSSLVLLAVLLAVHAPRAGLRNNLRDSLKDSLSTHGLTLAAGNVVVVGRSLGFLRELMFLIEDQGQRDVYVASAWVTGSGSILELFSIRNLTRSPSADDDLLTKIGSHVVYRSNVRGKFDAVTVLDLAGESEELTRGWPSRAKLQNALTNFWETGRSSGFGRCRFDFVSPSDGAVLTGQRGQVMVRTDAGVVSLDLDRCSVEEGALLAAARPQVKGMPGTITWVVDSVRSFVGPEPIEWLEHRVFSVQDGVNRWVAFLKGTSSSEQEESVRAELGVTATEQRRRIELAYSDPELGFPPEPIPPLFSSALAGEGQWIPATEDPFINTYPNAPVPFVTTFLRPDGARAFARIFIVAWDPRLVQLRMVAGTREPEGATGETGAGLVPRDKSTLKRLVAGFNGGFQALHGEFGMMVDKTVYLPPKPWAATVAVHQSGQVSMGSWTDPPEGARSYQEAWALKQVPDDMVDFRQNLTSVVESGRYNPWGRWWWGAAPINANEQLHIDRSGLCLTEEGFFAYFWGRSLGPEALGEAMLRARCIRALHLDMNIRHTGFEFLKARPDGELGALPGEMLGPGRYDGPMPHAPGYHLRARLLVRSMKPMRFPRYASRDPRDFFYLLLKPILPGPDLTSGDPSQRRFSSAGLPHAGFPRPFARLFRGAQKERGAWLVRLDLNRLRWSPPEGSDASLPADSGQLAPVGEAPAVPEPVPLAHFAGARRTTGACSHGLYQRRRSVGTQAYVGAPQGEDELLLCGRPLSQEPEARAALGVDEDGFVVYVELSGEDPTGLRQHLRDAGVSAGVALAPEIRLVFRAGETYVGVDAFERRLDLEASTPLYPRTIPASRVLFPETRPRPYSRWARLQDTRVRYVRENPPTFSRSSGGLRDEPEDE